MERSERGCGPLGPQYDKALTYVSDLFRGEKRKGTQVPYLSHLMAVSGLVLEDNGSETEAIAALLHDAVEDHGEEQLAEVAEYGPEVLEIVRSCSDWIGPKGQKKGPWVERKVAYVAHLAEASEGALRVVAADKLHNARSIATDLDLEGAWPGFNECKHLSAWYYVAVYQMLLRRLPHSRSLAQLSAVVQQLAESVGLDVSDAVGPEPSPCTLCTDETRAAERTAGIEYQRGLALEQRMASRLYEATD